MKSQMEPQQQSHPQPHPQSQQLLPPPTGSSIHTPSSTPSAVLTSQHAQSSPCNQPSLHQSSSTSSSSSSSSPPAQVPVALNGSSYPGTLNATSSNNSHLQMPPVHIAASNTSANFDQQSQSEVTYTHQSHHQKSLGPLCFKGSILQSNNSSNCMLKELFTACRNGDISKVRKLANPMNVNARDSNGRRSTPLHFAAGFGRSDVVELLLTNGANVHSKDEGGLVPLHNACSFGHADVVQLLLKHGADPNARDKWSYTPLHEAASKGKVDVVIVLIQNGADATIKNADGKTALDLAEPTAKLVLTGEYKKSELLEAARSGDEEKLMSLLTPFNVNIHASDGRKSTPLHLAAGYNRVRIVQLLLNHGADVQAKDKGGLVPLHNASSYGHLEVTDLLIKSGANVNSQDLWLFTPLHEATSKNRTEVCTLLLSYGADPYFKNGNGKCAIDLSPSKELAERLVYEYKGFQFLEAISHCDVSKVKKMLSSNYSGSTINLQNDSSGCNTSTSINSDLTPKQLVNFKHPFTGDSPLHFAVRKLNKKKSTKSLVDLLLRKGARINDKNKHSYTPLHVAVDSDSLENTAIVELLLKNDAEVNAQDALGETPLFKAVRHSNTTAAQILLSYGADIKIESYTRLTVEILAKESSPAMFKLLLSHKQSHTGEAEAKLLEASKTGELSIVREILDSHPHLVNCRDMEGRQSTPLHFAAGYNRLDVATFLIERGADVHIKDKGGLVPLHNACSYGHYEIVQLLLSKGASVNVTDLWKFTPLHEAAAKGKSDIVKLLLAHGADPSMKNRDRHTPLDLVRESNQEITDLFLGDAALLDACKKGDLNRVVKILTPANVNCRDPTGRNSTPLHLAAGYNNLEVAEYLLRNGAQVNAQDKGGLIPLHNAASYGHLDVAALLIRYKTHVNAIDRWGFTPLHEAAQKGRTQLCALLLAHGADATMKSHDGQTALDLAAADDVKCLLLDAVTPDASESSSVRNEMSTLCKSGNLSVVISSSPPSQYQSQGLNCYASPGSLNSSSDLKSPISPVNNYPSPSEMSQVPSAVMLLLMHRNAAIIAEDAEQQTGASVTSGTGKSQPPAPVSLASYCHSTGGSLKEINLKSFLASLELEYLHELLEREHVTLDILAEMSHEELKQIGIHAYGHRHRLMKGIEQLLVSASIGSITSPSSLSPVPNHRPPGPSIPLASGTVLIDIAPTEKEFLVIAHEMKSSIRDHKDGGAAGGIFSTYDIIKIQRISNAKLWQRYLHRRTEICDENHGYPNERMLFHGSAFVNSIIQKGFDERHAYIGGMFGAGIYFAENSSKSNQYVYGILNGAGCPTHKDKSCYVCKRQMLLCRVLLGKTFYQFNALKMAHAPPGHHSVTGRPSDRGGLSFPEYVVYRGEQAYPEYLITYLISNSSDRQNANIFSTNLTSPVTSSPNGQTSPSSNSNQISGNNCDKSVLL